MLIIAMYTALINKNTYAQCTVIGNKGTSCEYELEITFTNPELLFTHNGGNTVAQLRFDYNVKMSRNPCNFNGQFYTFQGVFNSKHAKIKNTNVFFDLENNVGNNYSGTATSANFVIDFLPPATFTMEDLAPSFKIEIHGPGIQTTLDCFPMVSPLPIELVAFEAKCENNKNIISWTTASEQNNSAFNVYQSTDGISWEPITLVKGNGNSNTFISYTTEVEKQNVTTTYYRLEQIDFSGRTTYYSPIALNCPEENEATVTIFPNPILDRAQVQSNQVITMVRVLDLTGKIIESYTNIQNYEFQLLSTQQRSSGIYIVEVTLENGLKTIKKIVQN